MGAESIAQWYSASLAYIRSWAQSPDPQKEKGKWKKWREKEKQMRGLEPVL